MEHGVQYGQKLERKRIENDFTENFEPIYSRLSITVLATGGRADGISALCNKIICIYTHIYSRT